MRERAQALGGVVNIRSSPTQGTTAELIIPDIQENEAGANPETGPV